MSILQDMARLVDEFQELPDWESRYKRIIALAKELIPLPEEQKTDDNKVRGCSSTVGVAPAGASSVVTEASMRPAIVPSIWRAPAPSSAAIGRVERHIADTPVEQWADYSLIHWECTG